MLSVDGDEQLMVGASIAPSHGQPLIPGERQIEVELRFWDEEAKELVERKRVFKLWYGRVVGEGKVIGRK
jgi:hypothetical protein